MAELLTALTLFNLREGTSDSQWNTAVQELVRMWESIPEVRTWNIGPNGLAQERSGGFSHVIMLEFDSEDDWQHYLRHPLHAKIAQEHLVPLYANRAAALVRRDIDAARH